MLTFEGNIKNTICVKVQQELGKVVGQNLGPCNISFMEVPRESTSDCKADVSAQTSQPQESQAIFEVPDSFSSPFSSNRVFLSFVKKKVKTGAEIWASETRRECIIRRPLLSGLILSGGWKRMLIACHDLSLTENLPDQPVLIMYI